MPIEEIIKGAAVGMQHLEQPDEMGNTWRFLIIDGQVHNNQLVPGSGSGLAISVFMDDNAAKAIHDATASAEPKPRVEIARVAPVAPMDRQRPGANGRRHR